MGRHDKSKKSSKKESKEDRRILERTRDYVKREERISKKHESKRGDGGVDDNDDDHDDRSNDEDDRRNRKRSRSRGHDDHDDDDGDRKRSRKQHSKRSDRSRRAEDDEKRRHPKTSERKKKSKHSSSRDERKSTKKIKIDKSKLISMGDIIGKPPTKMLIPEEDYFAFHQHLSVYLYREEGLTFGDLTSEQSRYAFQRFCCHYNEGKLEADYYQDVLPLTAIEETKTTTHKWSFHTSSTEAKMLHMIEEGVRKQTQYDDGATPQFVAASLPRLAEGTNAVNEEDHSASAVDYLGERRANKRLREHVRTVGEELTGGRKDGRERQLEKKKEVSASIHGASRDREDGGIELADADLYVDSKSDFAAALARERKYKVKKDAERANRLEELQQKEHDRQQAMLNALGLTGIKAGQKITIAPRNDTK